MEQNEKQKGYWDKHPAQPYEEFERIEEGDFRCKKCCRLLKEENLTNQLCEKCIEAKKCGQ